MTTADVGVRLKSEKLLRKTCGLNMGGGGDAGRARLPQLAEGAVASEHGVKWSREQDKSVDGCSSDSEKLWWFVEQL